MTYENIFITGGAGFVGSNLAIRIKSWYPEAHVLAADNLRRSGSEVNLPRLRAHGVEFVHCDVRNREDLRFGVQGPDLIVECSAEPSVLAGYTDSPDYVVNTNLVGTLNCLELARSRQSDFVFLSTSRVYPIATLNRVNTVETETRFELTGRQEIQGVTKRGISEAFSLDGARSLYGTTKLCSELLVQEYSTMYGLRSVINRCGVITGPWQMGKVDQGVFALWMARHYFGGTLNYVGWGGTGKQVRDMLDVEDMGDLLRVQLERFPELSGRTFNVGGGVQSSLSLSETTRLCEEITGHTLQIGRVPENRPADLKLYISDNDRVTADTGWVPRRTPRDTLSSLYEWLRNSEHLVRHLWNS